MKAFTKLLLGIGVLLTWTNQIVAMRPMLKEGELPPHEGRIEPLKDFLEKNETSVVSYGIEDSRNLTSTEEIIKDLKNTTTKEDLLTQVLKNETLKNITKPKEPKEQEKVDMYWSGDDDFDTSGAEQLTTICMVAIAQILIQNNII